MTASDTRPLIPYLRQSRAKERAISIDEQRRDIRDWAEAAGSARESQWRHAVTHRQRILTARPHRAA
jgi:hypothetical protein